jgi:REP element-mobilizing transposase RayT
MAVHKPVQTSGVYFITFTCHRWFPLIHTTDAYDQVYKFFSILNRKHSLLAFVIMPNHLHFMLHYKDTQQSLNTIIGNGKRFMAYEIVKRLHSHRNSNLLTRLSAGVMCGEKKNNKQHAVWEQSFDVKECRSERMTGQKLRYIHHNPISGKWKLSESFIDYQHSSARFYHTGKQHEQVKLTHFRGALHELFPER